MADEGHRAAKKRRYTSNIVSLHVGSGRSLITIHETLLQDNSPFFKAALEKQWKEGQTREIELPTDSEEVVAAYVDYLYARVVTVDRNELGGTDFSMFIPLYCFGEKVLDDTFCDAVMKAMVAGIDVKTKAGTHTYPNVGAVNKIYADTMPSSPLRRFIVDVYAQRGRNGVNIVTDVTPEFLGDLVRELFKIRAAPGPHGPLLPHVGGWLKSKT